MGDKGRIVVLWCGVVEGWGRGITVGLSWGKAVGSGELAYA